MKELKYKKLILEEHIEKLNGTIEKMKEIIQGLEKNLEELKITNQVLTNQIYYP
jgi:prefoldin subunit 5